MNGDALLRWLQTGTLLALGFWGILVAAGRATWGFLDGVNLVFHEAGHVFFGLAGHFIGVLGGSLNQVLIPAACAAVFVWQGQAFGAGLCGIWTGQSLVGVSIYMADARARVLPLLGGDEAIFAHDWHYLLRTLGLLEWDRTLGRATAVLAALLIAASALLGALACLRTEDRGTRTESRHTENED